MYISFATKTVPHGCEADCQFAADHHIPALDIVLSHTAPLTYAQVKALRHMLTAYGLRCAAVHVLGMNHLTTDVAQRQQIQSQRALACEHAAMLGASTFVTTSGMRSHVLDENAYMFAQELRPTLATLSASGIRFAVQPDETGFIDRRAAYERVWALIGQVYCVFDPVAFQCAGDNPLLFVHHHASRIAHVRATDALWHDGQRIAAPPVGMGETHWAALLGLLYEGGYDGALSITPEGGFWGRTNQRQRMVMLSQHHLQHYLFDADEETILATKSAPFYGRMV